jgi:hypothetical protein
MLSSVDPLDNYFRALGLALVGFDASCVLHLKFARVMIEIELDFSRDTQGEVPP